MPNAEPFNTPGPELTLLANEDLLCGELVDLDTTTPYSVNKNDGTVMPFGVVVGGDIASGERGTIYMLECGGVVPMKVDDAGGLTIETVYPSSGGGICDVASFFKLGTVMVASADNELAPVMIDRENLDDGS